MQVSRRFTLAIVAAITVLGAVSPSIANDDRECVTRYRLCRNRKDNLAISDLTRAAQIATKHNAHDGTDNIYVMRCMAYGDKGQYQKAIADCNEALRINPK